MQLKTFVGLLTGIVCTAIVWLVALSQTDGNRGILAGIVVLVGFFSVIYGRFWNPPFRI